ncbi:hypothetical protein A1Q2_05672 [Trichosporon asahii var. asahii CBS 8904]|uniref:Uncharacterized protein n=1 Tax=Trichosporon asahii var. asahii (strain CBS 8904) TaxID=1220162 RepID=K1WEH1_TRIAC|nr:hypothetical protein A1Q2_05672 [Trichosporon asahii var. asahii CBS 8904]
MHLEQGLGTIFPYLSQIIAEARLSSGTCKLSDSYSWPFDLLNSDRALWWVINRLREASTLEGLPAHASSANFPSRSSAVPTHESERASTHFGPFNDIGISLALQSCDMPPVNVARLTVVQRAKWLHYIHRRSGPLPLSDFPSLTHVVATMVEHYDFTDEIAMVVYGVFESCNINIVVHHDRIPSFTGAPSTHLHDVSSVRNGVTLEGINGTTVLFLACLVLQEAKAIQKLLDMEVTGPVILRDMANCGLGWVIQPRDAQDIISNWLERDEIPRDTTAPCPRLSLFLTAWVTRPGGPFDTPMPSGAPTVLYEHALDWCPQNILEPEGARDCSAEDSPEEAHAQVPRQRGLFFGCALGTAIALYLDCLDTQDRVRDCSPARDHRARDWVWDLIRDTFGYLPGSSSTLQALEAADAFLTEKMEQYPPDVLDNIKLLTNQAMERMERMQTRQASSSSSVGAATQKDLYRAMVFSLSGHRLRDVGANVLAWCPVPYLKEVSDRRLWLLGVQPAEPRQPAAPRSRNRGRLLRALDILIIGYLSLAAVIHVPFLIQSLASLRHNAKVVVPNVDVGLATMKTCVYVGTERFAEEGEIVTLLSGGAKDWCKVENIRRMILVSNPILQS